LGSPGASSTATHSNLAGSGSQGAVTQAFAFASEICGFIPEGTLLLCRCLFSRGTKVNLFSFPFIFPFVALSYLSSHFHGVDRGAFLCIKQRMVLNSFPRGGCLVGISRTTPRTNSAILPRGDSNRRQRAIRTRAPTRYRSAPQTPTRGRRPLPPKKTSSQSSLPHPAMGLSIDALKRRICVRILGIAAHHSRLPPQETLGRSHVLSCDTL